MYDRMAVARLSAVTSRSEPLGACVCLCGGGRVRVFLCVWFCVPAGELVGLCVRVCVCVCVHVCVVSQP